MNCISARETDKITDKLNCQLDQILGSHIWEHCWHLYVLCRLLSQVEERPCGFYCDRRNFYCPQGFQALQALQQNSHGAGKISEEDEEDGQTTCIKLGGEMRDFIVKYYILYSETDPSSPQTVNTSDRKFDKKLLKFSFFVLFTLFTSCHFQTVFFLPIV